MTATKDFSSLSGSYALHALDPEERAEFEQHLQESDLQETEQTRNEVTELSDTAVLLGLAVAPVMPGPALKDSIMAKLGSTPQLPSVPVSPNQSADAASRRPRDTAAPTPAERKARAAWFLRPVTALACAAAAVALIIGGGVIVNSFSVDSFEQAQADQLAAITTANDAQRRVSPIEGGGTATLVWSNELGTSALVVADLEPLSSDRDYQLWYIDAGDGVARPAGVFSTAATGVGSRVLDGSMGAGDAVGLTVEPAGGSDTPTTTPIVVIESA